MRNAATTETHRLLKAYRERRDGLARDKLVVNYSPLVRSLCNRFRRSKESSDDLFQVGVLGLLNAIEKYDPSYGTSFSSLAIPEVLGSILNYLRDHGTSIKLPRGLRSMRRRVDKAAEELALRLGRWSKIAELAEA